MKGIFIDLTADPNIDPIDPNICKHLNIYSDQVLYLTLSKI